MRCHLGYECSMECADCGIEELGLVCCDDDIDVAVDHQPVPMGVVCEGQTK